MASSAPTSGCLSDLFEQADGLRLGLRAFIESMPRRAETAGELARLLKHDRSSVWRIWKAAYAESAAETGAALSGEGAITKFVGALVAAGASQTRSREFLDGYEDFSRSAVAVFGDLVTARLALSRACPRGAWSSSRVGAAMFDSARFRQGVQAAVTLRVGVRMRSQFENLVDEVHARHFERLMTLDGTGSHLLQRRQVMAAESDEQRPRTETFATEPLCDELDGGGERLPEGARPVGLFSGGTRLNGRSVWSVRPNASTIETRASGGVCGRGGESDICMAEVIRAREAVFPLTPFVGLAAEQLVPAELLVVEFYISQEEFAKGLHPTPRAFDLLHSERGFPGTPLEMGGAGADVEHYEPEARRPPVEEVRTHGTLLRAIEKKLDAPLGGMHLFRWRVGYPAVDVNFALCAEAAGG